ncbi:hypothetical protein KZZ52_05380 [Dactylosporangium sp. AC04546]|uniref:hypothetical protein n=1 Tax=Dactylosporangium sp. AC04546 TaxID=2862460 RepID=UPI001EDE0506|nr:hypothetical protein [Dactylosporangium sp. AC04546]WVK84842.1 hypothetical protein KZZ52_05380 [Dactylosporangium sp. AC04546]
MRVARDFAVRGPVPYHAPERPRVADPDRRRQIADYLAGGATIGHGSGPAVLHTDGVWLWPERFVEEILEHGLAPEPDLVDQMRVRAFRAPTPAQDERLATEALAAWRSGPPTPPRLLITYFVRVDEDSSPDAPVSLLRRTVTPDGRMAEEALWRDMAWHATYALSSPKIDYDIREASPAQAARVLDTWCAKWHAEQVRRRATT